MDEEEVLAIGRIIGRLERRHLDVTRDQAAAAPDSQNVTIRRLSAERDAALRQYEQLRAARSVRIALTVATRVRRAADPLVHLVSLIKTQRSR